MATLMRACNKLVVIAVLGLAAVLGAYRTTYAQYAGGWANEAVGGVLIDPAGTVQAATRESLRQLEEAWKQFHKDSAEFSRASESRAISLRELEAALAQAAQSGDPIPEEIGCLGGLTRIEYVLVYPDKQDIVLVGPAEPWRLHERADLVGVRSGKPILLLDDLLVALRAAFSPNRAVISCSIDPTPEGVQRLNNFMRSRRGGVDPARLATALQEVLGPQKVTIMGVPEESHFARALVAADFRLKQISMGTEPAPIPNFPSFPELLSRLGRVPDNAMPRWWLAPDYEPLVRDEAGLTWKFRRAAVKTMVESDLYSAAGERQKTIQAAPVYRQWADMMTARYEELAKADPVFGRVRNCMDLATVAALIANENLLQKAGLAIPTMLGQDKVQTVKLTPAKYVPPKSVFGKVGKSWTFVTGGVQINAWEIASRQETSADLAAVRVQLPAPSDGRWWADKE